MNEIQNVSNQIKVPEQCLQVFLYVLQSMSSDIGLESINLHSP